MAARRNPFDWQSHHPEVEVPRPEVDAIAEVLAGGGSAVVLGGRGMGKSVKKLDWNPPWLSLPVDTLAPRTATGIGLEAEHKLLPGSQILRCQAGAHTPHDRAARFRALTSAW
jgi:hypothetical protein